MKYSILKLITDKEYKLRDLEKLRGFLIQKYEIQYFIIMFQEILIIPIQNYNIS